MSRIGLTYLYVQTPDHGDDTCIYVSRSFDLGALIAICIFFFFFLKCGRLPILCKTCSRTIGNFGNKQLVDPRMDHCLCKPVYVQEGPDIDRGIGTQDLEQGPGRLQINCSTNWGYATINYFSSLLQFYTYCLLGVSGNVDKLSSLSTLDLFPRISLELIARSLCLKSWSYHGTIMLKIIFQMP